MNRNVSLPMCACVPLLIAASCARPSSGHDPVEHVPTEVCLGDDTPEPADRDFERHEDQEYERGAFRLQSYYNDDTRASDYIVLNSGVYGTIVEWHPNGNVHRVGAMSNGKRVGVWIEFSDTGEIVAEHVYVDGDIVQQKRQ